MYREALLHCADDRTARLSLAQLHLLMGEVSEAEQECQTILDTDQDNQEAAMVGEGGGEGGRERGRERGTGRQ